MHVFACVAQRAERTAFPCTALASLIAISKPLARFPPEFAAAVGLAREPGQEVAKEVWELFASCMSDGLPGSSGAALAEAALDGRVDLEGLRARYAAKCGDADARREQEVWSNESDRLGLFAGSSVPSSARASSLAQMHRAMYLGTWAFERRDRVAWALLLYTCGWLGCRVGHWSTTTRSFRHMRLSRGIRLRPHQESARAAALPVAGDKCTSRSGRFLFPCGSGKTLIGIAATVDRACCTLILTTRMETVSQFHAAVRESVVDGSPGLSAAMLSALTRVGSSSSTYAMEDAFASDHLPAASSARRDAIAIARETDAIVGQSVATYADLTRASEEEARSRLKNAFVLCCTVHWLGLQIAAAEGATPRAGDKRRRSVDATRAEEAPRGRSAVLEFVSRVRRVILDEAHRALTLKQMFVVNWALAHPGVVINGMSATWVRENMSREVLGPVLGPVLATANGRELQKHDMISEKRIVDVPVEWRGPGLHAKRDLLLMGASMRGTELPGILNTQEYVTILDQVRLSRRARRKTIVFCSKIAGCVILSKVLGAPCITGRTPASDRVRVLERFKNDSSFLVLVASRIAGEGVDTCAVQVVVQKDTMASRESDTQRMGRAERPKLRRYDRVAQGAMITVYTPTEGGKKGDHDCLYRHQFMLDSGEAVVKVERPPPRMHAASEHRRVWAILSRVQARSELESALKLLKSYAAQGARSRKRARGASSGAIHESTDLAVDKLRQDVRFYTHCCFVNALLCPRGEDGESLVRWEGTERPRSGAACAAAVDALPLKVEFAYSARDDRWGTKLIIPDEWKGEWPLKT